MVGEQEDSDSFTDRQDEEHMTNLNELVTQINPEITAEQYLNEDEDLSTCETFDGVNDTNWRERLRSAAIESTASKRLALSRDLQLFLVEKGEEKAARWKVKGIMCEHSTNYP